MFHFPPICDPLPDVTKHVVRSQPSSSVFMSGNVPVQILAYSGNHLLPHGNNLFSFPALQVISCSASVGSLFPC